MGESARANVRNGSKADISRLAAKAPRAAKAGCARMGRAAQIGIHPVRSAVHYGTPPTSRRMIVPRAKDGAAVARSAAVIV
jgi:hypothetical protein